MSSVRLDDVWKSYPTWRRSDRTLQGLLAKRLPVAARGRERRWVLTDVSFEVAPGESVGVIGANGAGKSTLLRLAAGVGHPSRGTIQRPEDVAAVLSFDSWFDVDLTGRENALTALMVAGWSRAQAQTLIPAVLDFAELAEFADAPVRTYSEGMKLRIAFGVVAQLRPSALLIDEVIAVGDARFQQRCADHIADLRAEGTSLLLASHALDTVEGECDRAVWLEAGSVRAVGDAAEVVERYRDAMYSASLERTPAGAAEAGLTLRENRFGTQEITIDAVTLSGAGGDPTSAVAAGASLSVTLDLSAHAQVPPPILGVAFHRETDGVVCCEASTEGESLDLAPLDEGARRVRVTFDDLRLAPGDYLIDVGAYRSDWAYAYDFHWRAYPLRIDGPPDKGVFAPARHWSVVD